jgi:hypothetical protein
MKPRIREAVSIMSKCRCLSLAGELGFEPRLTESESAVLPLNYSPSKPLQPKHFCNFYNWISKVLQIQLLIDKAQRFAGQSH